MARHMAKTATTAPTKMEAAAVPNWASTKGVSSRVDTTNLRVVQNVMKVRLNPKRATQGAVNSAVSPKNGKNESNRPMALLLRPSRSRKSTNTEPRMVNWQKIVLHEAANRLHGSLAIFSALVGPAVGPALRVKESATKLPIHFYEVRERRPTAPVAESSASMPGTNRGIA